MADGLLNKASIILTPTGYKAGTLYNVAPVVEPYEDFDFSRASVASRVNSSGLVEMVGRTLGSELVTCGDFSCADPNDSWDLYETGSSTVTFTDVASINIDGSNSNAGLYQQNIFENSKTYKIVLIMKATAIFDAEILETEGAATRTTIGDVSLTTSYQEFTFYFIGTGNYDLFIHRKFGQTAGQNQQILISNVSVKEIIDTNNIPRISYDSNGDNGHILLEPTSTNIIPYSNEISLSTGSTVSGTGSSTAVTDNYAISPDGTQNAARLVATSATGTGKYALRDFILSTSSVKSYTQSTYLKSNTGSDQKVSYYGRDTGVRGFITVTSEWQRFELSGNSNTTNYYVYLGARPEDGTDTSCDILVYGYQLEQLGYATSLIPTLTGSTETRATETATGAGSADLINSTEGVLYAEIAAFEVQPDFFISMNDGTNNNRVIIKFSDGVDNQLTAFTINSTNASSITHTISNFKQYNKIALSYNSSYLKLFVNGQEVGTSVASPNLPVGLNVLNLSNLLTDKNVKGKVKSVAVFDEALSDAELNNLTG